MTFASGLFLWFLPLAALPVIFHLLMRRREKRLLFPDLMFFLKADPRMHARRRLREWLLLAARVLVLLLLLLTLSRPVLRHVPAVGGEVALAIVVDNSASMDGVTPDGQSKLELAREAARGLLNALPARASAVIVPLVPDPALDIPLTLTDDRDDLNRALDRLRRTEAKGSTAGAFAQVRMALDRVPPGIGRAVHLFSDLHDAAWGGVEAGVDPFEQADVVVHRMPSARRREANIAVASVTASRRVLLPGHAVTIDVLLRNESALPGDVRMTLQTSDGTLTSGRYTLGPGTAERIPHVVRSEAPGDYWVMVELEGDAFRGDNRGGLAFFCRDKAAVWFVGPRNHYGVIPTAVAPFGDGRHTALVPVFRDPEDLFPAAPDGRPALVVATWRHLSRLPDRQSSALRDYVTGGGGLLIVPDILAPAAETYRMPDWLDIQAGPVSRLDGEEAVVGRLLDAGSGIWDGLRAAIETGGARFFLMQRYAELEPGPAYRALAGITPRRPVMAERALGQGRIVAAGIAWDRAWTSLVTDPSGVAVIMLHNMARDGLAAADGPVMLDVVAGEPLPVPRTASGRLRSMAGDTLDIEFSSPPILARAGVYRMDIGGRTYRISVRGAFEEADEAFVDGDRLPVLGSLPHRVVTLASAGDDMALHVTRHFAGRSLFLPLALLTILVWALEAWLATLHGHTAHRIERESAALSGGTG